MSSGDNKPAASKVGRGSVRNRDNRRSMFFGSLSRAKAEPVAKHGGKGGHRDIEDVVAFWASGADPADESGGAKEANNKKDKKGKTGSGLSRPATESLPEAILVNPLKVVFGKSLMELYDNTVHQPVPLPVAQCLRAIEEFNGYAVVGIFRVPGDQTYISKLRTRFDAGLDVDMEQLSDVHDAAGLLKLYLRELPEPVLTFKFFQPFCYCMTLEKPQERLEGLRKLITNLPEPHLNMCTALLDMLRKVAANAGVNKMSIPNLSMIFAPAILRSESDESGLGMLESGRHINAAVKTLIEQYDFCVGRRDSLEDVWWAPAAAAATDVPADVAVMPTVISSTASAGDMRATGASSSSAAAAGGGGALGGGGTSLGAATGGSAPAVVSGVTRQNRRANRNMNFQVDVADLDAAMAAEAAAQAAEEQAAADAAAAAAAAAATAAASTSASATATATTTTADTAAAGRVSTRLPAFETGSLGPAKKGTRSKSMNFGRTQALGRPSTSPASPAAATTIAATANATEKSGNANSSNTTSDRDAHMKKVITKQELLAGPAVGKKLVRTTSDTANDRATPASAFALPSLDQVEDVFSGSFASSLEPVRSSPNVLAQLGEKPPVSPHASPRSSPRVSARSAHRAGTTSSASPSSSSSDHRPKSNSHSSSHKRAPSSSSPSPLSSSARQRTPSDAKASPRRPSPAPRASPSPRPTNTPPRSGLTRTSSNRDASKLAKAPSSSSPSPATPPASITPPASPSPSSLAVAAGQSEHLASMLQMLERDRADKQRPADLDAMTVPQLRDERRAIKKTLRLYVSTFEAVQGKPPSRDEQRDVEPMYRRLRDAKRRMTQLSTERGSHSHRGGSGDKSADDKKAALHKEKRDLKLQLHLFLRQSAAQAPGAHVERTEMELEYWRYKSLKNELAQEAK